MGIADIGVCFAYLNVYVHHKKIAIKISFSKCSVLSKFIVSVYSNLYRLQMFYSWLSAHKGEVYPNMHLGRGMWISACTWVGGDCLPGGVFCRWGICVPPEDGLWCSQYASYYDAFLFQLCLFFRRSTKMWYYETITHDSFNLPTQPPPPHMRPHFTGPSH